MEKMSRHPGPCNPGFLPAATHGVLKSLLENPMKLPLQREGEGVFPLRDGGGLGKMILFSFTAARNV